MKGGFGRDGIGREKGGGVVLTGMLTRFYILGWFGLVVYGLG